MRLQVRLTFLSHLQVRLSFGQMYPQDQASGQVDIWADLGQADLWSDVPPPETSGDQVCYYFSQADLCSDVSPGDEASGLVDIFVRSSGQADLWSDAPPRIRLQVRLTFG